jgi:hypothetical protein
VWTIRPWSISRPATSSTRRFDWATAPWRTQQLRRRDPRYAAAGGFGVRDHLVRPIARACCASNTSRTRTAAALAPMAATTWEVAVAAIRPT